MTYGGTIAALAVAMFAAASSSVAAQGTAAAPTAAPLVVTAACQGGGDTALLHVRIENRSARPTAVVMGKLVGTDKTQVVDSLFVMATRLATGAAEDFAFVNPKHAVLTGRTEPWIVTLPAGGTYELDAPVRFFVSRLNYSFLEPLGLPGTRVLFDAKPLPSNKSVWTGQVEAPVEPCR